MAQRFILSLERAKALATALRAVDGVADLSAGPFGEVALLYPGQRIAGMKFLSPKDDTQIAVHVAVAVDGPPLETIALQVRAAARRVVEELTRVDVVFADVVEPAGHSPA